MKSGSSPHTRGAPGSIRSARRYLKDHPRIRGEHPRAHEVRVRDGGIIPAYAGSTTTSSILSRSSRGSSPHTRGAPLLFCASCTAFWDHPRIRGEHYQGSCRPGGARGIIPAYAGSTQFIITDGDTTVGSSPHTRGAPEAAFTVNVAERDHPRIRGEHRPCRCTRLSARGIIPAYAGSTNPCRNPPCGPRGSSPHTRGARRCSALLASCARDHPRIRGEHQRDEQASLRQVGIIPAYAGSTLLGVRLAPPLRGSSPHTRGAPDVHLRNVQKLRDHPRIRGEH